jgi:hypothetical protein
MGIKTAPMSGVCVARPTLRFWLIRYGFDPILIGARRRWLRGSRTHGPSAAISNFAAATKTLAV